MIQGVASASTTERFRQRFASLHPSCFHPLQDLWASSIGCLLLAGCAGPKTLMAINVPVVDLRAQPHTAAQPLPAVPPGTGQAGASHDPLQESQLLYGERVRRLKVEDGWARVEAVEQPEFTHARRWQGYPGWISAAALIPWEPLRSPTMVITEKWVQAWQDPNRLTPSSWHFPLGTRLRATDMAEQLWLVELLNGDTVWLPYASGRGLDELWALPAQEKRQMILRNASLFLGDAYFWGGRSPAWGQTPKENSQPSPAWGQTPTGVDCSGLVNLAYRAAGMDIPRDAHEQFLRAKAVNATQPADLIFLSERENPKRIVHVMLYAGNGELIEGPGTGQPVRRIAVAERLGRALDWLEPGTVVDGQTVFFGTYFPFGDSR